jgi:hypothetical protein
MIPWTTRYGPPGAVHQVALPRHGFPRSHGPRERKVNGEWLMSRYRRPRFGRTRNRALSTHQGPSQSLNEAYRDCQTNPSLTIAERTRRAQQAFNPVRTNEPGLAGQPGAHERTLSCGNVAWRWGTDPVHGVGARGSEPVTKPAGHAKRTRPRTRGGRSERTPGSEPVTKLAVHAKRTRAAHAGWAIGTNPGPGARCLTGSGPATPLDARGWVPLGGMAGEVRIGSGSVLPDAAAAVNGGLTNRG